jgi:hypothetical protein
MRLNRAEPCKEVTENFTAVGRSAATCRIAAPSIESGRNRKRSCVQIIELSSPFLLCRPYRILGQRQDPPTIDPGVVG